MRWLTRRTVLQAAAAMATDALAGCGGGRGTSTDVGSASTSMPAAATPEPTVDTAKSSAVAAAWPGAVDIGTWGTIPASNTLAALNPDNDPLVNPNYPGTAPWRFQGSFAAMCTSWCGATMIPGGALQWVNCGGHGDKFDADSLRLVLNSATPYYERVCTPSGAANRAPMDYNAEYSVEHQIDISGRHRPQHTQSFQAYWPGKGIATLSGILLSTKFLGTPLSQLGPYITDPVTGELIGGLGATIDNTLWGAGSWMGACYDPVRKVGWIKSATVDSKFAYWGGPDNDAWTKAGPSSHYIVGAISMAYCPPHDLILVGNGHEPGGQTIVGGFGVFDPSDGTFYAQGLTKTYPTFTGAPTLGNSWSTGLWPGISLPQWAPSLGAFLAWDNSAGSTTKVMRITPPASGDPRIGTWTVDYLPVSSMNAVTPSAAQASGTYGRFFVWDEAGICGVVNSVDEPGYFFRYA